MTRSRETGIQAKGTWDNPCTTKQKRRDIERIINTRNGPTMGTNEKTKAIIPPVQRTVKKGVATTLAKGATRENYENTLVVMGKVKSVAASVITIGYTTH